MNLRIGLALSLATAAAAAHALDVTYTNTIPLTTTNYSQNFVLPKFDPSLGTLTGITFDLSGSVAGSARAESLDAAPATLTLSLSANISLVDPSNNVLAVVLPVVNSAFGATAFDGVIDFGGTSGVTFTNLSASGSVSNGPSLTPALVSTFVGVGNVTLGQKATGNSSGTGAGNLITQFATQAGSTAKVTYSYQPVPEPASMAALGLGAVALLRRRRKSA